MAPTPPRDPRPDHVLVTGGRGYVGRAVVRRLRAEGRQVTVLSSDPSATAPPGCGLAVADLADADAVARAVAALDVDGVVHLAARTRVRESVEDPDGVAAVNATGTAALLDALPAPGRSGPVPVVLTSTLAVYGPRRDGRILTEELPLNPTNPYADSKAAAERHLAAATASGRVAGVALRVANVAGAEGAAADADRSRMVPRALAVAAGLDPTFPLNGDGGAVRELVHVADLADAIVLALDRAGRLPPVLNVGSGVGVRVVDVLAAVRRVTGRDVAVEQRPPADEPRVLVSDSGQARALLGWTPRRSDLDTVVADAWAAFAP